MLGSHLGLVEIPSAHCALASASHARICPACIVALQLVSGHSCGAHARELTWRGVRSFCDGAGTLARGSVSRADRQEIIPSGLLSMCLPLV